MAPFPRNWKLIGEHHFPCSLASQLSGKPGIHVGSGEVRSIVPVGSLELPGEGDRKEEGASWLLIGV